MTTTTITMPLTISGSSSDIANFITNQREKSYELLQESYALGLVAKGVFRQLDEVFEECFFGGWDGANAKPILAETLQSARIFLKSLPLGIEPPDVGAEPDGAITLEWYKSSNKVISISINPSGWLYFAAIIGTKRRHGKDFVLLDVSEDLLELISQITGKAG
ncbi:MAG: hypothetical protein NTY95_14580 [Bacteroidia bacterium]|nr:hypothetical protein [Candidatus Atribacteria bacterium]MCX6262031.1 hypothetical protein [Bacteroidia bacterium]